jgi:hypothetical protein
MYQQIIEAIRGYIAADGQMVAVAPDGQFVGILTSDFNHLESVCNPSGNFGSATSITSMFNQHSLYGGLHGTYSPYNPHCMNPPRLIVNQTDCGVLTNNPHIQGYKHNLDLIIGVLLGAATNNTMTPEQIMALEYQQQMADLAKMQLEDYSKARRDAQNMVSRTLRFY